MSLAVLARKTRAKQKLRKRGKFILNMTGRGNVLGMNAKMSRGNCKGLTKCAGKRAACCVGVGGSQCCEFPHGGQPAPQQSYRVYLNRKSKGAYRPAGGKQCKTTEACTRAKSVWKQGSNLDAGEITRKRRDNILACNSDVYTAKRDTCTGCVDCEDGDSTLTVGYATGGFGNFWGYDNPGGSTTGNLVPNTIDGSGVRFMGFQTGGNFTNEFFVTLDTSGSSSFPQNFFNSITFANCKDKSLRTYNTSTASFDPQDNAGGLGAPTWRWNAAASGYSISNETAYWSGVSGENLSVFINNPNPFCCCPVKKNICGCRATDLVRYTRINKSFGCQTTKAVRMGRTASEQIARRRATVDCIKPKHRTIYIDIINSDGALKVNGCCGNQCLIQGQQYTFVFKSVYGSIYSGTDITLRWCPGLEEKISSNDTDTSQGISFTVPKFNKNCQPATEAIIGKGFGLAGVSLSYCKKAFKTPQMLGSCSGR